MPKQKLKKIQEITSEYFGLISLYYGLDPKKYPPVDIIDKIIQLAYEQLDGITQAYMQYKKDNHTTNFEIDFLNIKYGLENNHKLIFSAIECLDNLKQSITNTEENMKDQYSMALYYGCLIALQMYTLSTQKNNLLNKLSNVNCMNNKRKFNTKSRNELTANIKTLSDAISFIESKYPKWLNCHNLYKKQPLKHKDTYEQIPRHFKKWFKTIDEKGLSKKLRGILHYWKINKKDLTNHYIKMLLYKNNIKM